MATGIQLFLFTSGVIIKNEMKTEKQHSSISIVKIYMLHIKNTKVNMKDGLQLIYRTQIWQQGQAYNRVEMQQYDATFFFLENPYDATLIVHSPKNVDFFCCMFVCSRGAFNEFRAKLSQSKLRSKLKREINKTKMKN